ncbi:hypothetical protein BD770DRAFT_374861 [Pilaira anomala]|nr:hypothetical protein BD770DRAFT_374861 [Pilaira anomala]
MISPSSSPSTPPPRTLSLLNHESNFFSTSSPIYAPTSTTNYMTYPLYQPEQQENIMPVQQQLKTNKNKQNNNNTTIKSHACPVSQCMRRFKRLEHLKRHMRIHTLERPFRCSYPGCQKNFSRSDNLSQHIKTHQRHQEKRTLYV